MTVNNEIYETLGERWYTAFDDPVALLRQESKIKVPWVSERISRHFAGRNEEQIRVLDVGCGAGFLSNALAEQGFSVAGLDISEDSLQVARRHDRTQSVNYVAGDAYKLPFQDHSFDVVVATDFLEHVEEPERVIAEIGRILRPNGLFFYHTFNRNWLAYLVIIKLVEWFIRNTPKHMHVLELFLKPKEVAAFCQSHRMVVQEVTGLRPRFSTITLSDILRRTVPKHFAFALTRSLALAYMGFATKNPNSLGTDS